MRLVDVPERFVIDHAPTPSSSPVGAHRDCTGVHEAVTYMERHIQSEYSE